MADKMNYTHLSLASVVAAADKTNYTRLSLASVVPVADKMYYTDPWSVSVVPAADNMYYTGPLSASAEGKETYISRLSDHLADNNRDTVSLLVSVPDKEHYTVPRWVASEGIEQHTHRESVSVVQGTDKENCIYLLPAPVVGKEYYTDRR